MPPFKLKSGDKESDNQYVIQYVIQKLTTTGRKTLDETKLKTLKNICKSSDKYVKYAYYALMTQLRKDHAEVRYSTLLIINELFIRSSIFRSKLVSDFDEFLELVEGTDPENPLPLPHAAAKGLKIKGLEIIKSWCSKFGEKYTRLQLALTYLKKCRKVDFADLEARNVAQRVRQLQEEERLQRITNEKIAKVKTEMQDIIEEIMSVSMQMENCFRLLIPHPSDNLFTALDFENAKTVDDQPDSTEMDETNSKPESKLRHHGLHNMKTVTIELQKNSEATVDINEDTLPVIENLKDLEKQISTRFYPKVTRWLKILTKGTNCTDILKKAIDLKSQLQGNLEKYKELKMKPSKNEIDSDDDDDDFEEVKEKEGFEEKVESDINFLNIDKSQPDSTKKSSTIEGSSLWKMKHHREDINDPTSALCTLSKRFKKDESVKVASETTCSTSKEDTAKNCHKAELLQKAPVLPYDIDLYHWEEEKPIIPERVRFDHLHKFWESKDDEEESETLKEVQRASLRTRKIDFSGKFEPVKWACHAPLANGKLCPRRDRYKCPFHGKIIPRDALGNPSKDPSSIPGPSSQTTNTSTVPDWQDPQLLKEIEAATGIDLKIPVKGKHKKKDGLTNIKKINDTVRERLSKKIIKRYRHYAGKLDETEKKRFNDKFGDQWNYY